MQVLRDTVLDPEQEVAVVGLRDFGLVALRGAVVVCREQVSQLRTLLEIARKQDWLPSVR